MYYLSMEFLMGRSLTNALYNLQISGPYSEVCPYFTYETTTKHCLSHVLTYTT